MRPPKHTLVMTSLVRPGRLPDNTNVVEGREFDWPLLRE